MSQKQDQTHRDKQQGSFPEGHLRRAFEMLHAFVDIKPSPYLIADEKLLAEYLIFNPLPSETMPAQEAVYEAVRRAFRSAYRSIRPSLLQQYVNFQEEAELGEEILQHLAEKYFFLPYLVIALAATPQDKRPDIMQSKRGKRQDKKGHRKSYPKRNSEKTRRQKRSK